MLKIIEKNILGKDYVIGDLHGCYNQLEDLLKYVNFDKSKDRLFSVGDIINRGQYSLESLYLLNEKWFYAIKGNHENMLEWSLDNYNLRLTMYRYGGEWADKDKFNDISFRNFINEKVVDMPTGILIDNKVLLIHAEITQNSNYNIIEDFDVYSKTNFFQKQHMNFTKECVDIIWCKDIFKSVLFDNLSKDEIYYRLKNNIRNKNNITNKDILTICGHSILFNPIKVNNCLNIDSGSFMNISNYKYGLSIYDIDKQESYRYVSKDKIIKNSIIEVNI